RVHLPLPLPPPTRGGGKSVLVAAMEPSHHDIDLRATRTDPMDMTGEQLIPAPKPQTWAALLDPEVLKACIPGCEAVRRTGDNTYTADVVARVGPVKAKFSGAVTLSDIDAPNGCTISGEGKGGAAGFAKGGAKVNLADAPDGGTKLSYVVNASVGG